MASIRRAGLNLAELACRVHTETSRVGCNLAELACRVGIETSRVGLKLADLACRVGIATNRIVVNLAELRIFPIVIWYVQMFETRPSWIEHDAWHVTQCAADKKGEIIV